MTIFKKHWLYMAMIVESTIVVSAIAVAIYHQCDQWQKQATQYHEQVSNKIDNEMEYLTVAHAQLEFPMKKAAVSRTRKDIGGLKRPVADFLATVAVARGRLEEMKKAAKRRLHWHPQILASLLAEFREANDASSIAEKHLDECMKSLTGEQGTRVAQQP